MPSQSEAEYPKCPSLLYLPLFATQSPSKHRTDKPWSLNGPPEQAGPTQVNPRWRAFKREGLYLSLGANLVPVTQTVLAGNPYLYL